MKKGKRIFFCVLLFLGFLFSIYSFISSYELHLRNVNRNQNLIFPIVVGVFSFISLHFNLSKLFFENSLKSGIYKLLRIGDLLFSVSISVLSFVVFSIFIYDFILQEITPKNHLPKLLTISITMFLSVFLFYDNLLYHKEIKQKKALFEENFIEEIGK